MPHVFEAYAPVICAVNATTNLTAASRGVMGGFLAITAGTVTVADQTGTVVNAFPVAAGSYFPMPFTIKGASTLTTAGGASGVAGVL